MKGEDNPSWKTPNTNECRFKDYYKKRIASANPEEPLHKKSRSGKTYSRTSYAIKRGIKKEIKKFLARRDAGYIRSSDSESD